MDTTKRQAYQEKAEAQLESWSAKLDELKAEAKAKKAEAKIDAMERLEQLRSYRDSARSRLEALKVSGEETWQDLREQFEDARDEALQVELCAQPLLHEALDHRGDPLAGARRVVEIALLEVGELDGHPRSRPERAPRRQARAETTCGPLR